MISSRGALATCAAAAALSLASIQLGAQSSAVAPAKGKAAKPVKAWTMPRTTDGQPDLTGNWTNATYTPLERPPNLGTKEFYTKEEAAAVEKDRVAQFNSQAADDIHYDNAIWQNENYDKGLSSLRTSLVIDPPDGRIPALTDEARRRALPPQAGAPDRRTDSYENRTLAERCITWGNDGPPIMPVGYNANLDILQGPGYVVVRTEMIHSARIIPIDGVRPHVGHNIRKWNGDSRGHWEGNTLVVETTNFNDRVRFRNSTTALRVVERFTRVDADTITYTFTVEDPATWTKPWTAEVPMMKTTGPIYEYACHEGNYGLANILRAARVEEKATE
jgi:ribosomal protein L28